MNWMNNIFLEKKGWSWKMCYSKQEEQLPYNTIFLNSILFYVIQKRSEKGKNK